MNHHRLVIEGTHARCECGTWESFVAGATEKHVRDEAIRQWRRHKDAAEALAADRRGGFYR